MRTKIKLAAALVALISLLLSGCGYTPSSDTPVDGASLPADVSGNGPVSYDRFSADEWLATVPSVNCGGYSFTIVTAASGRFTYSDDSDSPVDTSVKKRNSLIQDKYNIKIVEKTTRELDMQLALETACSAGLQYSDFVSATMPTLAKMAASGLLSNLYSLPYYDSAAAFSDKTLAAMTVANHTAYVTFDSLSMAKQSALCVFFNKSAFASAGVASPYELVYSGGWTWNKFLETAGKTGGFLSYGAKSELALAVFSTYGVQPVLNSYGSPLSQNTDTAALDIAARSAALTINSSLLSPLTGDYAKNAFLNGSSGMLIGTVSFASVIADSKVDWGILPLPSDSGALYSMLDQSALGIAVPAYQTESDRTGILLTAFTAASFEHLEKAQKTNLIYFALRDNDSAVMLDKIFDSVYVSAGLLYSGGFSAIDGSYNSAIVKAVVNGTSFVDIFKKESALFEAASNKYFR